MAVTFTEAMVEVADCHTTLYHLGASRPQTPPLPLTPAATYGALYAQIDAAKVVTYAAVTKQPGVVLNKLYPVYRQNHYWNYFFANDAIAGYPALAWEFLVPILCSVNVHVDYVPQNAGNFKKVSPLPRVFLYPFGWSNWLSLRLQGEFTLQDLSDFNVDLFAGKSLRLTRPGAQPTMVSVRELFAEMSEGVRVDAFGGTQTKDFAPREPVVVTTILARYGAKLTLGGLNSQGIQTLLRIVKPEGPAPSGKLMDYVHRLQPNKEEKYVVMNNYGRFVYLDDRLKPVERNYQHLRCYHNNTFNSLLHARHLYQLLSQAVKLNSLPVSLGELADKANAYLVSPSDYYENASLREFLLDPAVAEVKKMMEKFQP